MNIQPIVPVAESVPTEQDALVFFLVNIYRHSVIAANKAVEEYEAPDEPKRDIFAELNNGFDALERMSDEIPAKK